LIAAVARESAISAKSKPKTPLKATERPGTKTHETKGARFQVPFTRKNYIAFGVGIGVLLLGYICLAQPPVNGFLSLTLAPILLVLGYCVIFPYAIMARDRSKSAPAAPHPGD
jgi:hypothetical protein